MRWLVDFEDILFSSDQGPTLGCFRIFLYWEKRVVATSLK